MINELPAGTEDPFHELRVESRNYWAGRIGQESPPLPTYRELEDGKLTLGRYMGPFECLCHMKSAKDRWSKWWISYLIPIGVLMLAMEIDFFFMFIVLPLLFVPYLIVRHRRHSEYAQYYRIYQEVQRTGEPQWEPYDKDRLALIDRHPLAVWP